MKYLGFAGTFPDGEDEHVGGFNDFIGMFEFIDEFSRAIYENHKMYDWRHLIDIETFEVVDSRGDIGNLIGKQI